MTLFAQSLVEYGALERIRAGVELLVYQFTDWAQNAPTAMWLTVAVVAFGILWFFIRRPRRF